MIFDTLTKSVVDRIRQKTQTANTNGDAMTDEPFSKVIRGGTAVLPQGVARADIGIRNETIAAISEHLGAGINEINADGRIVAGKWSAQGRIARGRAPRVPTLRRQGSVFCAKPLALLRTCCADRT